MKPFAYALSLILGLLLSAESSRAANAEFSCKANGRECYFTVFYRGGDGGSRNFHIAGGKRDTLSGIDYSQDVFCVCIDKQVPNSYSQCSREASCKAKGNVKSDNDSE